MKTEDWIDINKETPCDNQWCLVSKVCSSGQGVMLMAHQFVMRNYIDNVPFFHPYGEQYAVDMITHWMPLPSPPDALITALNK